MNMHVITDLLYLIYQIALPQRNHLILCHQHEGFSTQFPPQVPPPDTSCWCGLTTSLHFSCLALLLPSPQFFLTETKDTENINLFTTTSQGHRGSCQCRVRDTHSSTISFNSYVTHHTRFFLNLDLIFSRFCMN